MNPGAARPKQTAGRPVSRALDAMSRLVTRTWSLPPRRNRVTIDAGLTVPMRDGTVLLADHYIPAGDTTAATVLVRCPYGRAFPFSFLTAQLIAERGYHVLLQSCRGTFGSGGVFEPMRSEIDDGQDTVAWLREQDWFTGRLATYGGSYLGFVQWALAMDPPPELVTAIVHAGPHDLSRTAYHNGVFDLYNYVEWSELMANQERVSGPQGMYRMATADRRLRPALDAMPITKGGRDLLGAEAPWFESWLRHPDPEDMFWQPLQCRAALDRIAVPVLLITGWHDLFLEQTLEQYRVLAKRGVTTRLVVGPWAHLDEARAGVGIAESLRWLDQYAGPAKTAKTTKIPKAKASARVYVTGTRNWRDVGTWPPPDAAARQEWFLSPGGELTSQPVTGGADATFRYDPADPTPTTGGAIMSLSSGSRDNKAVERRLDVLVFTSAQLELPVEMIGDMVAELAVTRDNPHADLFVRLCDVDPRGRSRNICDGVVRLTERDPLSGTVLVSMVGAAHRFGAGHRVRLQVSGGAHPRFARNPGNGKVESPPSEFVPTRYRIGTDGTSRLYLGGTAPGTARR